MKKDLHDQFREFKEIVVEYPPEELCTYPEYKGKPYFGIKYKENGEEIVGYGTYKPEVLSQYLKDYFISTTNNNIPHCQCTDAEIAKSFIEDVEAVKEQLSSDDYVSREKTQEVIRTVITPYIPTFIGSYEKIPFDLARAIQSLPSVTYTHKKGHWIRKPIRNDEGGCVGAKMICSCCNKDNRHDEYMDYCPNCGAKMEGEEVLQIINKYKAESEA